MGARRIRKYLGSPPLENVVQPERAKALNDRCGQSQSEGATSVSDCAAGLAILAPAETNCREAFTAAAPAPRGRVDAKPDRSLAPPGRSLYKTPPARYCGA